MLAQAMHSIANLSCFLLTRVLKQVMLTSRGGAGWRILFSTQSFKVDSQVDGSPVRRHSFHRCL